MSLIRNILNKFSSTESKINRLSAIELELNELSAVKDLLAEQYSDISKALSSEEFGCKDDVKFTDNSYLRQLADIKYKEIQLNKELNILKSNSGVIGHFEEENRYKALKIVKSLYKEGKIGLQDYNKVAAEKTAKGQVKYADVIVVNDMWEILLTKRSMFEDAHQGAWVIPGGHVDKGEDFETAAERELLEEAGISVQNVLKEAGDRGAHWFKAGEYSDKNASIHYYCLHVPLKTDVEILLDEKETRDYKWVPREEIDNYEMVFNMKDNIKDVMGWNLLPNLKVINKAVELGLISEDMLEKAKKAVVGETHNWGDKKMRKQPDGTWKEVTDDYKGLIKSKLEQFATRNQNKDYPNVSEFAAKVLPYKYSNKYKNLYSLASSVGVNVNIEKNSVPRGFCMSWGMRSINIDPNSIVKDVNGWGEFTEALNHETIHGLISNGIQSNLYDLNKDLLGIWNTIQLKFDSANEEVKEIISYIADSSKEFEVNNSSNPDEKTPDLEELVTYAFTNKPFVEFLQGIESTTSSSGNKRSVFSEMVDILKSFIKKSFSRTALDDIKDVVEKYFDIDWNVKQFGERNVKYDWGLKFKVEDHYEQVKLNEPISQYFDSIIGITSGNQKKYYETQKINAKDTPVISSKSVLSEDEYAHIKRRGINKKACFYNAYKAATNTQGVKYVEGYVTFMGIPIEHAWNEKDGKYFDLTHEIALGGSSEFENYTSILELDRSSLDKYSAETGTSGPFFNDWYKEQLKDNISNE